MMVTREFVAGLCALSGHIGHLPGEGRGGNLGYFCTGNLRAPLVARTISIEDTRYYRVERRKQNLWRKKHGLAPLEGLS